MAAFNPCRSFRVVREPTVMGAGRRSLASTSRADYVGRMRLLRIFQPRPKYRPDFNQAYLNQTTIVKRDSRHSETGYRPQTVQVSRRMWTEAPLLLDPSPVFALPDGTQKAFFPPRCV